LLMNGTIEVIASPCAAVTPSIATPAETILFKTDHIQSSKGPQSSSGNVPAAATFDAWFPGNSL
jgi:hypothetical protein